VCKSAIDLGFSSVMMDGSLEADGKTIASYDYNVDVTKQVVDLAHAAASPSRASSAAWARSRR
jgi:fructose-bisphosphate aldolase class II